MSTFCVNISLWENIMAQLDETQELKKQLAIAEAKVEHYKEYINVYVNHSASENALLKAKYEKQMDAFMIHYTNTQSTQKAEDSQPEDSQPETETPKREAEENLSTLRGVLEANFILTDCVEDFVPSAQVCEAVAVSLGNMSSRTVGKMMSALGYKGKVKKVSGKGITVYERISLK